MSKEIIRIGSRESALAVIQSELAIKEIQRVLPEAETVLVTMKTTGDRILNRPLDQIGGKGLFVKELDQALLDGRCDLTVHSLKDMPMEQPPGLPILAYLKREDPRDVLVLRRGLSALPPCPVIGTSSKRRALQAERLFPGAVFEGCRGNLVTRMKDVYKRQVRELNAIGIETEPIRIDEFTNKKMTFFKDPDGLPLELHE